MARKKIKELISEKPVWCEYHDKELTPKVVVYRLDSGDHRFYYFLYEGAVNIAIGFTSAFGAVLTSDEREGIERWKEKYPFTWRRLLNVSASYGTLLHICFMNISRKQKIAKTVIESMTKLASDNDKSADMPVKDILALMKFTEDCNVVPLLIEAQLVWRDPVSGHFLALTIDTLVKMETTELIKREEQNGVYLRGEKKGQPRMITVKEEVRKTRILIGDLKSNFFEKEEKSFFPINKRQLIAGARAVEQNFGIKVDGCFNLSPNAWRTNPGYTYYEHTITDEDIDVFDAYWNLIVKKKINVPKGNILVCNELKTSSDYKMLSYQEYAEEQLLPKPIKA